jgi:hypothetical protein
MHNSWNLGRDIKLDVLGLPIIRRAVYSICFTGLYR